MRSIHKWPAPWCCIIHAVFRAELISRRELDLQLFSMQIYASKEHAIKTVKDIYGFPLCLFKTVCFFN